MKDLLNYKSLIKVAIMIVVIALIGSQMMDTEAGRGKKRNDDINTSGGGNTGGACDVCEELAAAPPLNSKDMAGRNGLLPNIRRRVDIAGVDNIANHCRHIKQQSCTPDWASIR